MLRGYDDLATFNKQNVDAFVQAGNIWAKGAEELGKAYFSFAQASAEKNAEAAKSLLAAKSLKDVVDVQADYARTSFDTLVAEGTRLNQMTIKVAHKTFAPIQDRLHVSTHKAFQPSVLSAFTTCPQPKTPSRHRSPC